MRSKSGAARNRKKKRIHRAAKGFVGGRRRLLKSAKETLLRAGMFAFRDRRARKREFRKHEGVADAMFTGSAGAAAFFQRVVEIEPGRLECGDAAEQNAGEHGGRHREK